MLGNDIIDLKKASADSDWKRKSYLNKLFTSEEQTKILDSSDPEKIIWQFWSMKEAAYKIIYRQSLKRTYNPKKFHCEINGNEGIVIFGDERFYTKSKISSDLIHTVAVKRTDMFQNVQIDFYDYTHDYTANFNLTSAKYVLVKDAYGIPGLIRKTDGLELQTSISHHGRYLAIVFLEN